jgi:hypothetical protein
MKDKRWMKICCYNPNGFKIFYHEIKERNADGAFKLATLHFYPSDLYVVFEWDDRDFIEGQIEVLDFLKVTNFNVCALLDNNEFTWLS